MENINLLDLPVNELKRQLATSQNFSAVMKFFFDHFAERRVFLEASQPVQVPELLKEGLRPLILKLWPNKNVATKWRIAEVALLSIVHGTVFLGKTSAMVVWARDVSVGIIAIPNGKRGDVLYARISVAQQSKASVQ